MNSNIQPRDVFVETISGSAPVPPSAPLPRLPPPNDGALIARQITGTFKKNEESRDSSSEKSDFFASPPPQLFFVPDPSISFVHRPPGVPLGSDPTWDGSTAISRGDPFHLKYFWNAESLTQIGRLMLGAGVQGPPGSSHGGGVAAVLDDIIGTTGMMCALQLHLQGVYQGKPPFVGTVLPDLHNYIDDALNKYRLMSPAERKAFRLHPDLSISDLETKRDKLLPYTAAESSFILTCLAGDLRHMPVIANSSFPPTGLVSELTCRLKKRVPLLTRLVTRGRMTKLDGKRVEVVAEVWGKKTTRISSMQPDESGEWEGEWDVLLAEGKGTLVVIYGVDLKEASMAGTTKKDTGTGAKI